jgi:hypothetical protein
MFHDSKKAAREITPFLDAGEKIIWAGMPKRGIVFNPVDLMIVPFGLIWGGFAFYWVNTVLSMDGGEIFALFGLPFVFSALYIVVGRFIMDKLRRSRTYYAITPKRILIKSGLGSGNIRSVSYNDIPPLNLNEKLDRSGTLVLAAEHPSAGMIRGTGLPGSSKIAPALEMIPDVKKVYLLIYDLKNQVEAASKMSVASLS